MGLWNRRQRKSFRGTATDRRKLDQVPVMTLRSARYQRRTRTAPRSAVVSASSTYTNRSRASGFPPARALSSVNRKSQIANRESQIANRKSQIANAIHAGDVGVLCQLCQLWHTVPSLAQNWHSWHKKPTSCSPPKLQIANRKFHHVYIACRPKRPSQPFSPSCALPVAVPARAGDYA
jgi:hypothetical protein